MMTNDERVKYCEIMKNLTTVLRFKTGTAIREESVEQIKKFADIYYTLAKAGLYREMDPEKLTPEMLDKIR